MKSFDTELQKIAAKTRLKAAERSELRARILSYMEYHPLPKDVKDMVETMQSQPFVFVNFNTIYTRIAAGVFATLLLIVMPLVAERSVPGDTLYLIKTNINESVRAQFANSPYEKVAFETSLLERRVAEARLLAESGELTEEVGAAIAETVKIHANAVQEGIADIKKNDADEGAIAEIAFGSTLDIQSAVLDSGDASSTDGIAGAVKAAKAVSDEKKGTSTPSYAGLMAQVELETTRAIELFESINNLTTDEERSDVERRIADIDRKIVKAQESTESNQDKAVNELAASLSLIQKVIVFMTDIDVRESVTLETLVPVEPTDEERAVIVSKSLVAIGQRWPELELLITEVVDEAVAEKVAIGVTEFTSQYALATTSLSEGALDVAEASLEQALAMLVDIEVLVEKGSLDDEVVEESGEISEETPEEVEMENNSNEEISSEDSVEVEAPEIVEEELGTTTEPVI